MKLPLNVDLIAIIRQAIPQIYGSDERGLLEDFLLRVDDNELMIKLDLKKVFPTGSKMDEPGPGEGPGSGQGD